MRYILPVIVLSQFLCTSLWFAGNAVVLDIVNAHQLDEHFLAHLTSAIQFGFISGTFVFALLSISDKYSPSLVFFVSAILAALFNLGITFDSIDATQIILFRFLTGFFLAGIYPVGMKIASDYYQSGLGKSLGFLVGALVLGTAFPHLLKDSLIGFPWQYILYSTSFLSIIGGLAIFLLVPNGPYRKLGQKIQLTEFMTGFKNPAFRAAAFGYFGHMWELYTFWAFVPAILYVHKAHSGVDISVSFWSFLIIASGSIACVMSGILSQYLGAKKVATWALFLSFICCVTSPLFLLTDSTTLLLVFLFIWGLVVIADSPLFSTLVAQSAPEESRGTSLTIVNCIGFAITIVSIQFINLLMDYIIQYPSYHEVGPQYIYVVLGMGPAIGLVGLLRKQ
ncbi:MAG: MFS transporter [Cytophagaceae bacterium]